MRYDGGVILSLDLATRTGFAVGDPAGGDPAFGYHDLPSSGDCIGRFGSAFDDWFVGKMIAEFRPALVVYEQPSVFKKTTPETSIKLNGLAYDVEKMCWRNGRIPVSKANPSRLKKFWTGRGDATKADMVTATRRHGFKVLDHNVADAIAIWALSVFERAPQYAGRFALGPLGAGAE